MAFFHHILEHLTPVEGERAIKEIRRVLAPGGHVSIATPNPEDLIKPRKGEIYYTPRQLVRQLGRKLREIKIYSLLPNDFALTAHRRKQQLARLPLTGRLRDLLPEQWEWLYGCGKRKVTIDDLFFIPGVDTCAIDFLLIASRPEE